MSRELLCKVYLDPKTLKAVIRGEADPRKQVLFTQDPDGNITGNGYVHFEKDEPGKARTSSKGRVAINVREAKGKNLLCRVHVDVAALRDALTDAEKRTKQVLFMAAPGGEPMGNGWVHFDRESGSARFSDNGRVRINVKSVKTREEQAAKDLADILPTTAETTAAETPVELLEGITEADIAKFLED